MKIIRVFLSENFQFWKVKCSVYLNRRVFVMVGAVCHVDTFINGGKIVCVTVRGSVKHSDGDCFGLCLILNQHSLQTRDFQVSS